MMPVGAGAGVTRILIAEDEARIASFLEKGLKAEGYATVVARRGPETLLLASSGAFDLLILDLGLPGMDGFDVLEALRERDPDLPVVVLTARAGVTDTRAGVEHGANAYLSKPFAFEELVDRVRGLVAAAA
jgi:two-component system copper resistance phosphate regulon response regulator CusR